MSPHSTAQLLVQQYRERSPSPYVGMKEKSKIIKKLYENEPPIFAVGILSRLPKQYLESGTLILRMSGSERMHVYYVPKKPGSLPILGGYFSSPSCV